MLVFAKSDTGLVRQINEDSYICIYPNLFLVADGMGGHVAGEIASKMAVQIIGDYLQCHVKPGLDRELLLEHAIIEANELIFQQAQSEEAYHGMGTTLSAVYVEDEAVYWGHVGDSRIYLVADGCLRQLTSDHSLVWELVQNGSLTKQEAEAHPQRNMLTRAVGTSQEVCVDTGRLQWQSGQQLLLCSDGLTNMLTEQQIYQLIDNAGRDGQLAVDVLIAAANDAGGLDNITAVLLKNEDV